MRILDACLREDPNSRVACETLTATGLVVIAGEISTKAYRHFKTKPAFGSSRSPSATTTRCLDSTPIRARSFQLNKQSPDIAMGVDTGGAGDQG